MERIYTQPTTTIHHIFILTTLSGVAYTAPVFGSIAADAFFGRYTVIKYVGLFYTLGVVILTLSTLPQYNEVTLYPQQPESVAIALFMTGVYIIAIGTGGSVCSLCFDLLLRFVVFSFRFVLLCLLLSTRVRSCLLLSCLA